MSDFERTIIPGTFTNWSVRCKWSLRGVSCDEFDRGMSKASAKLMPESSGLYYRSGVKFRIVISSPFTTYAKNEEGSLQTVGDAWLCGELIDMSPELKDHIDHILLFNTLEQL